MKWIEISIKTTIEAIEAVANILYETGVTGVVIEDAYNQNQLQQEDAIIKAYLPLDSTIAEKIQNIEDNVNKLVDYNINKGKGEVKIAEISDEDWANSWKKYYKPQKIGKSIIIKPEWENYIEHEDEIVIELDPGMAFGTGTHETTIMCLEILEKYVFEGCSVLDVGCGSGILSIAASKLGADVVTGVDVDDIALKVAARNIELNNLTSKIFLKKSNLLEEINKKADIIVTNISSDIIRKISSNATKNLKNEGAFIASGIVKERLNDTKSFIEKKGFDIIEIIEKNEWVSIVTKLPTI